MKTMIRQPGRPASTERNRLLIEYKEKHPKDSFREIGRMFKMSKQAAWFIYQRGLRGTTMDKEGFNGQD